MRGSLGATSVKRALPALLPIAFLLVVGGLGWNSLSHTSSHPEPNCTLPDGTRIHVDAPLAQDPAEAGNEIYYACQDTITTFYEAHKADVRLQDWRGYRPIHARNALREQGFRVEIVGPWRHALVFRQRPKPGRYRMGPKGRVVELFTHLRAGVPPPIQIPQHSLCNDGEVSPSVGQGACSWHGGVKRLTNRPATY